MDRTLPALLLAAALTPAAAAAEQAWAPAAPAFDFRRAAAVAEPPGERLDPNVLAGLARLAQGDVAGLGAEAARADAWSRGREGVRLVEGSGIWSLRDASGAALRLSPALGPALRSMDSYFGLTGPTLANPVNVAELKAAFLSPAAVAEVRRIFERTMTESVAVGPKLYLPELGGELTLDGRLAFHFVADPQRPALRALIALRDDAAGLARFYAEHPADMARLDPQGILRRYLDTRRRWDAEGRVPVERRDALQRTVVDTVAEEAAGHYSGDGATQLETMISDRWSGRYVGPWHCHPPDMGAAGWTGEYPPSEADYEAAAKTGQEIVIAFVADGFDVYELGDSVTGSAFTRAAPFASYRAPDWAPRFQALFDRLARK